MATLTEKRHCAGFMVSEAAGYRSRQKVLVTAENLQAGTVLGRVLATDTTVVATGTGNGALTMDATTPLLAGVQEGVYRAICIEPGTNVGTFAVYDPQGVLLGTHVVAGTAFSNQIKFAIADGATDFVSGDRFDIYVRAGTATAGTNTGNGTCSFYLTSDGVQTGTYTLTCTAAASNAGTFSVTAPDGTALTALTVGTRYQAGGLDLTLNDGSTDFIVGDSFTLTVTRGKVKGWDPLNNVDGTGTVFGILWDAVDASSADAYGTAIVRDAEVNFAELVWDAQVTASLKETAKGALAGLGIIAR